MKHSLKTTTRTLLTVAMAASLLLTAGCKEDEESEAEALLWGHFGNAPLNLVFNDVIDGNLTKTCGNISAVDNGDSGTSSEYDIESLYTFKFQIPGTNYYIPNSATMLLKYTYNETGDSYTLSPNLTLVQSCPTIDNLVCDSTGALKCQTVDNINCGGDKAFIFKRNELIYNQTWIDSYTYTGYSGTIDWSEGNGIILNAMKNGIEEVDIKITMMDVSGNAFSGRVRCIARNL